MSRPCEQCARPMSPDTDDTPSPPRWCSEACADKATAGEGWIRVADLTPVQRAELDAIIGPRAVPS